MRIKQLWLLGFWIGSYLAFASTGYTQDTTPSIPDLIGMNIPQATAALNNVGMMIGSQLTEPWTEVAGIPPNTISAQSIPAQEVPIPGGTVDVLLTRLPNVRLIYDDNDLTLINNTGTDIDFNGLSFGTAESAVPAALAATRWGGRLSTGGCAQVWSVIRSVPKDIEGCNRINTWLTTSNPAEHFWTGLNSVTSFNVVQNGTERGTCPAAPAGTDPINCDVFLPTDLNADTTPYLYLAYTVDRLIIYDHSETQFMPLNTTRIINRNAHLQPANQEISISDPALFTILNPVATTAQLAPEQCIFFTSNAAIATTDTPEACHVIARIDIDPNLIFWSANFDLLSVPTGQQYTCNAAVPEQLTICVMPR